MITQYGPGGAVMGEDRNAEEISFALRQTSFVAAQFATRYFRCSPPIITLHVRPAGRHMTTGGPPQGADYLPSFLTPSGNSGWAGLLGSDQWKLCSVYEVSRLCLRPQLGKLATQASARS